ncbi:MAG: heavy-metal-associated domain-containing protein [Prevotellaceae bacterium]|jgi:copper chaperone CopZ|nr:heavy-metal-associated domain-containing protein [Prevotellaceae bacterium]
MKALKIGLLALALGVAASLGAAELKKGEAEVTFKTNIETQHCKNRVEDAISRKKGVEDMNITIPDGTVYIKYRSDKTNVETLQKAIEKLNYTVEVAS